MAERRHLSRAGFATATMLGLLAVIALLSAGALYDALFGEQLATSRVLHQRAMALADIGVAEALARIAAAPVPISGNFALQPLPGSTESVSVAIRHRGVLALSTGFSGGRIATHSFEIESTGHAARGSRMTQVQGAQRQLPGVAEPAP
jgi:Tfp pilus assembly protein PilX